MRFILRYGALTGSTSLIRIIRQVRPDKIDKLAVQGHVAVSLEAPGYTTNADAPGMLRMLEAIRILGLEMMWLMLQAGRTRRLLYCDRNRRQH